jgi:hypothetical protein
MRVIQIKPVWEFLKVKELGLLKTVPLDGEETIPLTHQLMDPLQQELPWMMLEPLHCCGLNVFI